MIKFTLKSTIRKKSFYWPLLLILGLIVVLYMANLNNYSDASIAVLVRFDEAALKKELKQTKKNSDTAIVLQNRLETEQSIRQNFQAGNWSQAAAGKITINHSDLKSTKDGQQSGTGDRQFIRSLNSENIVLKYVVQHNVRPETPGMPIQGLNFTLQIMDYYFPMVIIVVMVFMIAHITVTKFSNHHNHDLLLPRSLISLDLQRSTATIISLIISYLGLIGFTLLFGSLLTGFGDPNYPIVLEHKQISQTLPIIQVILQTAVLQLLAIISLCLLTQFFANLTCNLNLAMLLTIGVTLFQTLIPNIFAFVQNKAQYFPAVYYNATGIVTMQVQNKMNNWQLNFSEGCLTLLIYILVIIIGIYITSLRKGWHQE